MAGEYTIYSALATVQIMEATGCSKSQAVAAFAQIGDTYVGRENLTADDLTTFLLDAIIMVRAQQALA